MDLERNTSPTGAEAFRCASWTTEQGIDPLGSATPSDRVVIVEVPLPWPAEIESIDWLSDVPTIDGTRLQLVVPHADRGGADVLVTCWANTACGFSGTDHLVSRDDVALAVTSAVLGQPVAAMRSTDAPAEVLICSHGSRDRCCGSGGTRLAVEARAALGTSVRVRRTSHLGGHRFAPTALTFPDGRCWSHLDAATLVDIVERRTEPTAVRRHYRGNVALPAPAQVAEAAMLADCGWCDGVAFSATIDSGPAGVQVSVRRSDEGEPWHVLVAEGRRYPVLQCGQPPSQADKTAATYSLR